MTAAARNQADLGELLGVTQQAVSKLVKSDGWPVKRRGPWSAGEVRQLIEWHTTIRPQTHRDAAPMMGGGTAAELNLAKTQMEILLKKAQREKAQLEVEIKKGKLVQRELLDKSLGGLANEFVAIIEQLRTNLPRLFDGVDKDRLNKTLDAYLKRLANMTEIQARSVEDVISEARRRAAQDKTSAKPEGRKRKGSSA